jgi:MBG domain (YGX type)/Bacterial Ig-like domain (group 3)/Regulator of chromosome condensation (RCC1) repeat/Bacterial Ig-like domain (group 2)
VSAMKVATTRHEARMTRLPRAAARFFGLAPATLLIAGLCAVSAGPAAAPLIAASPTGTVTAWGDNTYGETTVPAGLSGVTAIAAAGTDAVALKSDGTVVAWGNNQFGQASVPAGLSNVVAIAAGGMHTLALKSDGTVVAWGDNSAGQTTVPAGLLDVVAIRVGALYSLALKSDGTVVAWGDNTFGQTSVPAGLSGVVAISAGGAHGLALKSDGTVVAWGLNNYGQTNVPDGLSGVVAVAAGDVHSLALRSDGTVVAWGLNSDGQANVPAGLSGVIAVAAGGWFSLALVTPKLTHIVVSPADPTIVAGTNEQFSATGYYTDGSTKDLTASVTWASDTPAVATIAADGRAYGVSPGTSTIGATLGVRSGTTLLTVSPAPLTIRADDKTMTLGGPVPPLTWTGSGWINADSPGSLTTQPTCTTTATPGSPLGTYPITCSGAVDATYDISYVDGTLTVAKPVPVLTYTGQRTATPGATITLAARLTTPAGAPISKAAVVFNLVDGATQVMTDHAGVASVSIAAPAAVGSYPIGITFGGNATYGATSTGAWLTVAKIVTVARYVGATTATPGAAITLVATLTTQAGQGLRGMDIVFGLNGETSHATTDRNGVASVSVAAPSAVDTYQIGVAFGGNATYGATSTGAWLTVAKIVSVLTYTGPTSAAPGAWITLSARLSDPSGQGIAGMPVLFTINGSTVAQVGTDKNGTATYRVRAPSAGSYRIGVSFAGNATYAAASTQATLTVR